jgi:DNA polymerase III epsilon subunit-like protein
MTSKYALCFDTETTGLWKNRNAPITDNENWPYIVQLAWISLDMESGIVVSSNSFIIKLANDRKIPPESTKIHGITNEDMDLYGVDIKSVLEKFLKELDGATYLVAHNLNFDQKILRVELYRNKFFQYVNGNNCIKYCTMRYAQQLYRFRSEKTGKIVKKYPKLKELHSLLFRDKLNEDLLHDALADTLVCLRCFYKMVMNIDIQKTNGLLDKISLVFKVSKEQTNADKC